MINAERTVHRMNQPNAKELIDLLIESSSLRPDLLKRVGGGYKRHIQ